MEERQNSYTAEKTRNAIYIMRKRLRGGEVVGCKVYIYCIYTLFCRSSGAAVEHDLFGGAGNKGNTNRLRARVLHSCSAAGLYADVSPPPVNHLHK
jgi:hypothetical protein